MTAVALEWNHQVISRSSFPEPEWIIFFQVSFVEQSVIQVTHPQYWEVIIRRLNVTSRVPGSLTHL